MSGIPEITELQALNAAEEEAWQRFNARKKNALLSVAIEVLEDPHGDPREQRLAHEYLLSVDGAMEIDRLTALELDTLDALISKMQGQRHDDLDLVVVAEERPIYAPPCEQCSAREGRHYVDVTDFDPETRQAIEAELDALRKEP